MQQEHRAARPARPGPPETRRLETALATIGVHLAEVAIVPGPYEVRARAPIPDTRTLAAWAEEHLPGKTLPELPYSYGPGHEAGSALTRVLRGRGIKVRATGAFDDQELVSILLGLGDAERLAEHLEAGGGRR